MFIKEVLKFKMLEGKKVLLRALEPEDLDFLYKTENNTDFWEVSHTITPFSKYILQQYIANSHLDLFEAKQLRLIIQPIDNSNPVGMIDLYDFNPIHKRAGVGIVILKEAQNKGFASEALQLLVRYSFTILEIHQLYANVGIDNIASQHLFEKHAFKKIGVKKDWLFSNGSYKDELFYQLIS